MPAGSGSVVPQFWTTLFIRISGITIRIERFRNADGVPKGVFPPCRPAPRFVRCIGCGVKALAGDTCHVTHRDGCDGPEE